MKILDVDLLQDGLKRNKAMLERLRNETENIERTVSGLVEMDELLKGAGGNAIRDFYAECHLPFLQFFQLFSVTYLQTLEQMESALQSLEPDPAGYIRQEFLEGELEQGLTLIGNLTEALTNEANSIMDSVSDIVALPHLDDSAVQEGVITSEKKRDDTVQQLNEFDYSQTVSLNPVEQDIQTMDTWLTDIEGMFQSGLTDVHFQPSRWGILASRNTLKIELETRQTLSVSFHNQYNWNTDKLLSILEYKRPILFGFSGFINRESPFISPDLIVISNIKKETSLNKSFESGGVFVANVSNKITAGTHENVLFPLMQAFDSDKNPTEVWRDLFAGNLNDGESTYNLPKNNSKVAQTIADTLGYTIGGIGLTKALRGAGLGMKTGLPFLSKGRILSATKEGAMVGTVMASTEIAGREIGRPKDYNWKENTIQFGMEVVGGAVLDPLIDTALPLIKSTSSNPAKKLLNNQPVISHSSSSKIEIVGEVDKGTGNGVPSYGKKSVPMGPYREINGFPAKVKPGSQEKHIPNTPNYKQELANGKIKSIFYGDNKKAQVLLDKYVGEGQLLPNGKKERVDFSETIGKYYDVDTGEYLETTRGIIHYGKDGAHIVPSEPLK